MIRIASTFDIGLTKYQATGFQKEHEALLARATRCVEIYKANPVKPDCWAKGSFPLVLKYLMLNYSSDAASPRPEKALNQVFYCLDDYNRVTTLHMASLEVSKFSGNEMSPGQETAYRRWEDSRSN